MIEAFETSLRGWSLRSPDAPAILAPGRAPLLWADLCAAIDAIERDLRHVVVRRTGVMAVLMPVVPETALIALALMRFGTVVPLNPAMTAAELSATLARLGVDVLVADPRLACAPLDVAQGAHVPVIVAEWDASASIGAVKFTRQDAPLAEKAVALAVPSECRLILQTSGTTALPKLVPLTGENLVAAAKAVIAAHDLGPSDRALALLAQFHIGGLWDLIAAPLMSGGSVIIAGAYSRVAYAAGSQLHPTWVQLAPAMMDDLLSDAKTTHAPGLRMVRSVSAALPATTRRRAQEGFGVPIVEIYGMTETAGVIASQTAESPPGCVGRPVALDVIIRDDAGQSLPVGVTGEVVVQGAQVSPGYIAAPETETAFGQTGFRTGDLGHLDADGQLWLTGRIKDLINRGGEMIAPAEIEAVLSALDWVAEVAAFGLPHPSLGESIAVALVLGQGAPADAAHVARQTVRQALGEGKLPSAVHVLPRLPRSAGGKLLRSALAKQVAQASPVAVAPAPKSKIVAWISEIWAATLDLPSLSAEDDFFALGGTSLQAAHAVARMQEAMGDAILYVSSLYEAPTPARYESFLRASYPELAAVILGRQVQQGIRDRQPLTAAEQDRFARSLARPDRTGAGPVTPTNGPAVFLLSAPRSGSTLLRAMLAGHPGLFAPPELYLLSHQDMADRQAWFRGPHASQLEGLPRAVMAAFGVSAADAAAEVAVWQAQNLDVREVYARLQQAVAPRLLVDKTPFYAVHPRTLAKAEACFDRPLYIHLTRHPYGMIRSFEEARLDQLWWPRLAGPAVTDPSPFAAHHLAELLWGQIETTIAAFLATVDPSRHVHLRYEDLVQRPAETLAPVCRMLGLEFDPVMLEPQGQVSVRMTDGLHPQSRMIGDPKFHRHSGIEAGAAQKWLDHYDRDFLCVATLQRAAMLGHGETIATAQGRVTVEI